MWSKTNHLMRLVANILLWAAGVFFLLSALVYLTKAVPAAIAMLVLALLLMPFTWRKIRKLSPKAPSRLPRLGLVFVVFVMAMVLTPPTPESSEQSAKPAVASSVASTKAQASSSPSPVKKASVTNQVEALVDVTASGSSYVVKGTGAANTNYSIKLLDSSTQNAKTNGSGTFTVTLAKNTPVFGSIELVQDTNGLWFGGEKTVAKAYYSLDGKHTQHSAHPLKPVVFGISNKAPYEMSGNYTPGATLVVKTGSKELAKAKVDDTGRFNFTNVSVGTNFMPINLYERTSTGWFSSEDMQFAGEQYVDTQAHKLLSSLPTYTKEITVSQSIPFTEQTVESSGLAKGETKVTQEGIDGSKDIIYVVTYTGNSETGRQQKGENVTKQPTAKITTLGTYVAPPAYTVPVSCPNGTYVNSAGNTVCSPYNAPSAPPGAAARCGDGSYSFSQSRSGTCSHHGGVASWL